MSGNMKIKVRIAPSPTGFLHIGTARTALFNWLFAKKNGGKVVLRIEDTDKERSDKKYEKDIKEGLKWLGLDWDEEYKQSERTDIYKIYLERLLESKKAFWCYHSKEELAVERKEQETKKEAPRHVCSHKLKTQNSKLKTNGIIRLVVNENSERKIKFRDEIRGEIEWKEKLIGDFSIAKDLDMPLYNFTAVIDDIEMKISHVIRGEDHISNTPKQLLVYESIDEKPPIFAHLPLILGQDRSKLSKRHGAVSVNEYKKDYLPDAIVNFMGFLGFTYDKEILTKDEMISNFKLSKVHKSGAIFNVEKLNWINSQYIRKLSAGEFRESVGNNDIPTDAVPLITERLEKLSDCKDFNYFWHEPKYKKELLKWKKNNLEESMASLKKVKEIIKTVDFNEDTLRQALNKLGQEAKDRGLAYWPLRVALTGKEKSPDPVDVALVLGKEKTIKRINEAIKG